MTPFLPLLVIFAVAALTWCVFQCIPDGGCKLHDWRAEPGGLRCAVCKRRPSDE